MTRREQLAAEALRLRDAIEMEYELAAGESDEADELWAAWMVTSTCVDLLSGQRECVAGESVRVIGTQRVVL